MAQSRVEVKNDVLKAVMEEVKTGLNERIKKHGRGSYIGPHEALGQATEEYQELVEAVHQNNSQVFRKECLDLLVVCLFAMASQQAMENFRD